jgi:hypothetical protein
MKVRFRARVFLIHFPMLRPLAGYLGFSGGLLVDGRHILMTRTPNTTCTWLQPACHLVFISQDDSFLLWPDPPAICIRVFFM